MHFITISKAFEKKKSNPHLESILIAVMTAKFLTTRP